uniref:Uncharacterized protein n=1 Tax=viral metagenome TaxID=1070528 RepID=A0A6H1ZHU4_9ZZZZ
MPDNELTINPAEEQVQSSQEATDDGVTLEKIRTMTPEQQLEFYTNSQEAIKAATRRNMETAEERKRWQAELEYSRSERQRSAEELQRTYDLMNQWRENLQPGRATQPPPPNYEELPPEQAYSHLAKEYDSLRKEISELKNNQGKSYQELRGEVERTQRAIEYREFLKDNVYPKYKYVTKDNLDGWFTEHPGIDPDPKTVLLAAEEIERKQDSMFETEVQRRLAEKARKAEEAATVVQGAALASLPEGKSMIDLDPAEQMEIIQRDIEKLTGGK